MTHPITIPPELLRLWEGEAQKKSLVGGEYVEYVATKAGQYCADQELDACCEWLVQKGWFGEDSEALNELRSARRPKPPSLKEQALEILQKPEWSAEEEDIIRQAVESIPDPVL